MSTPPELRLASERIITADGVVAGEVVVRDGVIAGTRSEKSAGAHDLGDRWLAPGFIDTHVHGGGGAQCNTADPEEIAAMAGFHAGHGTTALLPTLVPAPAAELRTALTAIASARERPGGAAILGAHLEGPYLSPVRPGALDPAMFLVPGRAPDPRLHAGVRMMTLAPELPGAHELIRLLSGAGVVVSLGHTDADYAQTTAAVQAGARSVTHLFNAMAPFHHRAVGAVGAALEHSALNCELICDGRHVDPAAMRIALRAKTPAGIRLVTDAIAAAGMPDGRYRLGARAVDVAGGRARLAGSEGLAGSTLTMDTAVANAVSWLGLEVQDAVALASTNPARLLGLEARKGSIAPGLDADLVVLDDDLHARGTMIAGAWV